MSSSTFYQPTVRSRWFKDRDGIVSTSKRSDEIIGVVINWAPQLATGETISSVAYEDSGVTRTGVSNSTTTSTCNVTGIGYFIVTATLSTGRKLQDVRRFYDVCGANPEDYR